MYNIVIIGSGQLGSRHLQGLKTINLAVTISLIDPNPEALEIARQRYNELEENGNIIAVNFLNSIHLLPDYLDLVIIATNSLVRANITESLLTTKTVKNIVFEKFLFPALSDYVKVAELVNKYKVNAWVNCPRRMFSYYKEIKTLIQHSKTIDFSLSGGDWGLACNSIHFIDIFSFITGDNDYKLDCAGLDNMLSDSKRRGYIEFTGTVKGRTLNGHRFSLTSIVDSAHPTVITINTDQYAIEVIESLGKMKITTKEGPESTKDIKMLYQSQLTGVLSEQILKTGRCELTPYADSMVIHTNFLRPIVDFYNSITGNTSDSCPIT